MAKVDNIWPVQGWVFAEGRKTRINPPGQRARGEFPTEDEMSLKCQNCGREHECDGNVWCVFCARGTCDQCAGDLEGDEDWDINGDMGF